MESRIGMNGPTLSAPLHEHAAGTLPKPKRYYMTADEQKDLISRIRAGGDTAQLAEEFGVSKSCVQKYRRETLGPKFVKKTSKLRNSESKTALETLQDRCSDLEEENSKLRGMVARFLRESDDDSLIHLLLEK